MFRTEILIDGECYRSVQDNAFRATMFAREVATSFGIESTGTVSQLGEALLDDDRTAWVEIAQPLTTADWSSCPQCDIQGSFAEGDDETPSWCEACGYDSEEA
jgi:hypothetical protein